jgi:large subunit ribosomal protein L29
MQAKDLRSKSNTELLEQLKNLRKELKEVSMSVLSRKEKNVKKPRDARKDIARVLSVLKEKQILEAIEAK